MIPGIEYRQYILNRYLDSAVNRYKRRYCQDKDTEEIQCDRYDPDWQISSTDSAGDSTRKDYSAYPAYSARAVYSARAAYSAYSVYSEYSGHSEYTGYLSYIDYTNRNSPSNKSIVSQTLLISNPKKIGG